MSQLTSSLLQLHYLLSCSSQSLPLQFKSTLELLADLMLSPNLPVLVLGGDDAEVAHRSVSRLLPEPLPLLGPHRLGFPGRLVQGLLRKEQDGGPGLLDRLENALLTFDCVALLIFASILAFEVHDFAQGTFLTASFSVNEAK